MNVSKVTITNPKLDTQTKEYNSNYVMVSLLNTYVEYSTVLVEYTLSVTNQGKVAGYAKELIDYLPAGMAFSSDLNNNWYLGNRWKFIYYITCKYINKSRRNKKC